MTFAIIAQSINKSYKNHPVLIDLHWKINQGDIVGLLGRNGAGKSTLLKSLLNISTIDSGKITLLGEEHTALSDITKNRIGYVPQENDEINWLSVNDLINLRKQFYLTWSDEKVDELISRWKIDTNKTIAELSPGQVQRVLIILALATKPELLIFDEPASALDPAGRRELLKEIINIASEEKVTVIFSTHITSDLERIANKVAILDQGKICYFDDLDTTKENIVQLFIRSESASQISVPNMLRSKKLAHGMQCIVSTLDQDWLTKMQTEGTEVNVNPMGLEDIFLELTS